MKNKVLRVLLGCVLGAMLVPVTAAVPAESAKNNKKEVCEAADSVVITYEKVNRLPACAIDGFVIFSKQEAAEDLKKQFVSASSQKELAQSIIPGIKNLLSLVNCWVTELKAGSATELTKTFCIQLKGVFVAVMVTAVLKKTTSGATEKIEAKLSYVGMPREEPVYITNLLRAVFERDASSQLLKVVGDFGRGHAPRVGNPFYKLWEALSPVFGHIKIYDKYDGTASSSEPFDKEDVVNIIFQRKGAAPELANFKRGLEFFYDDVTKKFTVFCKTGVSTRITQLDYFDNWEHRKEIPEKDIAEEGAFFLMSYFDISAKHAISASEAFSLSDNPLFDDSFPRLRY